MLVMNASIISAIGFLCQVYHEDAPFPERDAAKDELNKAILSAEQAARADARRATLEEAALFVDNYKKDQPETVASIGLRFHLAQGIRTLAGKKEGA